MATGCDNLLGTCGGWGYSVSVDDTLAVGEQSTPDVTLGGCPPDGTPGPDALRWFTEDTVVVAVEEVSGRITALAPGSALVRGRVPEQPHSTLDIVVVVVAEDLKEPRSMRMKPTRVGTAGPPSRAEKGRRNR